MASEPKVVPFKAKANQSGKTVRHLPATFTWLSEKAERYLKRLLRTMYDSTDDALFELADRSETNLEQNRFFESMREVRLRRRQMEQAFFDKFQEGFRQAPVLEQQHLETELDDIDAEGLSLVQNDELEERVAMDTMVTKTRYQYPELIAGLTARMSELADWLVLTDQTNPLAPKAICDAFWFSAASLDVDVKAKIVLYKLFERHVLRGLEPMYQECNQLLIDEGILPSFKMGQSDPSKTSVEAKSSTTESLPVNEDVAAAANQEQAVETANSSMAAPSTTPSDVARAAADQSDIDTVDSLTQQWLNEFMARRPASVMPSKTAGSNLPVAQLLNMLSVLQGRAQAASGPAEVLDVGPPITVEDELNALMARQNCGRQQTNQVDSSSREVIELVTMLFQFIFEDRSLTGPMKSLIGRLQVPILKVALLDKNFFLQSAHPARRLLNEIAATCMGWSEDGQGFTDPLYKKVHSIVERVLGEFETDLNLFGDLLGEFTGFVDAEKRRVRLLEQRTLDAETGRARSELARTEVNLLIESMIAERPVPEAIELLLQQAWANVLFLARLRCDDDPQTWQDLVKTTEDLIWSVQPQDLAVDRERLLVMVPGLLKRLRLGLESVSFDPFAMSDLFEALELIHLDNFKRAIHKATKGVEYADDTSAQRQSEPFVTEQDRVPVDSQPMLLDAEPVVAAGAHEAEQALSVEPLSESVSAEAGPAEPLSVGAVSEPQKPLIEPSASSKTSSQVADADPSAEVGKSVEPALLVQVDSITMGTWFEVSVGGEKSFRARLAAIIKATGKYIFVNRSGVKVAEMNRLELAQALRDGSVSLLDDHLLFDRALESVIGSLRDIRNG